ncbi:tRNA (cytosine(32)/uridine(32)-2'-O)-methyltransferase TrmJ [Lujinxingia litoralis]|uniref:tRNA (Cytosine(32)/uridine(32)-2'-O)-methyltransferase TrmJ n=1 Tax=Lujinxingia litoralis TaxID=2211119 RepID=A0A328C976_9DELT|nr:TrmH family RNA methyltransferase [Lujinxingia litoralis]RAL23488.1 tRNA (cytosine(32)/uridine(32)-2'-O)-methyltransferase TrmJ [Lujinxingia litoralis]
MNLMKHVSVVLVEPQDDINIGNALRASKNFGVEDLRLVNPAHADPRRILISAPRADESVARLGRFESLDEALKDSVMTVGLTARARSANWRVVDPEQAAIELIDEVQKGRRVSMIFGREDSGLPNSALDRCQAVVTIPTNPEYSSINLGQAVLLMVWEVARAARKAEAGALEATPAAPQLWHSEFEPAPLAGLTRMFEQAEETLRAVEFFKASSNDHIMRSLRSMFLRARLDTRELAIWHGIFKEVVAYIRRKGIEP